MTLNQLYKYCTGFIIILTNSTHFDCIIKNLNYIKHFFIVLLPNTHYTCECYDVQDSLIMKILYKMLKVHSKWHMN